MFSKYPFSPANKLSEIYLNSSLSPEGMQLIITIPAYNEEKTIGDVIRDTKRVMDTTKYRYKILVIDDGSKDKTAEIAKSETAIVVSHPKNYGLVEAFKTGMQKCLELKADVIVNIDADGQYKAEDIPKLIQEIKMGYDLVLGSRFKGHIETMPLIKRFGNKAFSRVISKITGQKISDGQTGFRAFTGEVAKINITSNHTYTQEQIIRASKTKFKIKEIPIYFAKRGAKTKSRLMKNPFEYAAKAGVSLLRIYRDYKPLKFFGIIGTAFFGIGLLIGLWFIYLHFTEGIIGHMGLLIRLVFQGFFLIVNSFVLKIHFLQAT